MENLPLPFRKWIKECIKEEFQSTIEKELDKSKDPHEIAQRVIQSREMVELVAGVRSVFNERCSSSRANSIPINESRPQTSMSLASDLSCEEWGPVQTVRSDHLTYVINKINYDKPIHVRLAGYEALMRSELTNVGGSQSWEVLLKSLRDGLADDSQPIFEASLQAHAKLLNGSQAQQDVFTNLLNAFNSLYHSKRSLNMLPTFVSGINFKVFLHEKLFRIVHLVIRHQEESLKSNRNTDKLLEEVIEQFVTFLSSHTFGNTSQIQNLNILNIVSVLEPKSDWSRKWTHSLATRKILTSVLGRFPALLQSVLYCVRTGLAEPPTILTAHVADEIPEVNISGETVKTATYLHCLCLVTQLCSKSAGRQLLTEIELNDEPFNVPDFMLSLLSSLNTSAVEEVSASIYDTSRSAMQKLLDSNSVLYDARFHELALDPLLRVPPDAESKIHPHTIDVMMRILDTEEGSRFIISESPELRMSCREGSTVVSPAVRVLEYVSDLLQQPLSIMNTEHVVHLLKFVGRLFELYDVCYLVRYVLEFSFYPAISCLYDKMDKYSVENEIKKQALDSAIKTMLLKIVSMPLALQLLTREESVFEELLRGSVEPLKSCWSCNDVVAFISSAASLPLGSEILEDLAPHFLTKALTEICTKLEDMNSFYDPWEDGAAKEFLHVLRLFSLSNSCFIAVLYDKNEENLPSEDSYPRNLCELLHHSTNFDSVYHCLALSALNSFVHNLDANIYLNRAFNFQKVLLDLQENCIIQTGSDSEPKIVYTIDEGSLLRHKVLLNSYYIISNSTQDTETPEQTALFSKLPPSSQIDVLKLCPKPLSQSELGKFLQENKPGLRDTGWVSQARKAHRISSKEPIEHSVLIDLLDQMQKAVPTLELTCNFKWPIINENETDTLLPEEVHGIELALLYAEQNELMQATPLAKANLKIFLKEVHGFIKHGQFDKFEGFDWFVATVFIICSGDMERGKTFITQIVQFPSIIYLWSMLGKTISQKNNLPMNVQMIFSHLLEGIIANELPTIKYALKNNCGTDWWIICNGLISHCFWRTLRWPEITNLLAICILYPPDYTLYYCASLLYHSQNRLIDDIATGKMWPESMDLTDYRCGNYFQLMDLLSKRYRNTTLSLLMDQEAEITT